MKCVTRLSHAALGVLFGFHTLFGQLYSLQTHDLRLIYYDRAHAYVVPHLARCFQNALAFHSKLFDYTPTEKVTLLLQDFGDYGNGGASAVPRNIISVGISPFQYTFETSPANERMNALMNHELVHITALDKSSSTDRFYQSIFFGKVLPTKEQPISMLYSYLTSPRRYSPRWYHEGIASFLETWMDGGIGRAMGSYDEMVFRTMVRDSMYIYDVVGLESEGTTIDFQVKANSYLYGTRIMCYLAYRYGPQKLIEWVARSEESDGFFATQFKKVFGISLDDAWSDWIDWEHQWQRENLDSIRLNPVTQYRPVSKTSLGSVSRAFYDAKRKRIYVAVNYPGQIAHIAGINFSTGKVEHICDVKGAALYYVSSVAYDDSSGTLFYTTDNNKWRDLNSVNVATGKSKRLIEDVRTGDLAFNRADKSVWGVRHLNGISTIVRIPPPYTDWNQVYSWPYGIDVFDIDISPDGSMLTGAFADVSGNQKLVKLDIAGLMKGDATYEALYDFENNSPQNFVFSDDGNYLYGTTYYNGVSNIVRYDIRKKDVDCLTNCETGFFRPMHFSQDSLLAFVYTGRGFVPVMLPGRAQEHVSAIRYLGQQIVDKYPIVTEWKLDPPTPSRINIDSLKTFSGEYHNFDDIDLTYGYPVVQGYKNFPAYGMHFNFSDPLLLDEFDLTTSYTPNSILPQDERLHAELAMHYWKWHVSAAYNNADFYDLFGPTKTSRKGYSLKAQYKNSLIFDEPRLLDYTISFAGYGGLERLPEFQNIISSFDRFLTFGGSLNYSYVVRSLGAVDDEQGVLWDASLHNTFVNSKLFPRFLVGADYGLLLPINHSSVWLRSSAGYSPGDKAEPFANFYLGGFGNNWVDYQAARRYREPYSFPGVPLDFIGGTNFAKLLVEWTLPPLRFRRLGVLSLYCNWAQLSLFSSAVVTNIDDRSFKSDLGWHSGALTNAGAQIDFKLVIFSLLESTLSAGYAVAFDDRSRSDEFMVSLKLLK